MTPDKEVITESMGGAEIAQPHRACTTCRKVKVCVLIRDAIALESNWNERNGELIKFPFMPISLAQICPEYESPFDVIQLAKEVKA